MVATRVWVVPGFAGTELYLVDEGRGRKVWIDIPSLLRSEQIEALRYPTDLGGGSVVPGGFVTTLGYGYESLLTFMRQTLPSDWEIRPWPYDWRRPCLDLATNLADAINAAPGLPGGDKIVAHSYGAMVACAAWGRLSDIGQSAQVNRIVTIGGILAGTYSPVKTWRFEEDGLNNLALVSALTPFRAGSGGIPSFNPTEKAIELVTTFNTWPSVYDMLPDPGLSDDPGDLSRALIWAPDTWAQAVAPPSPALLTRSLTGYKVWAQQANHWPPPGVLVCCVGYGQDTAFRMVPVQGPALTPLQWRIRNLTGTAIQFSNTQLPSTSNTQQGDNRATLASQMRPGVQYLLLPGAHAELQSHPTLWQQLNLLLTGPGTPAGPIPVGDAPSWPIAAKSAA